MPHIDPQDFLRERILLIAGNPSMDIGGGAGDARRRRKGLGTPDVLRLQQANPEFKNQIESMYLPGPLAVPFMKRV